jgi:ribosomal protein L37AE/L43A
MRFIRRVVRVYRQLCASEDVRRCRVRIPDGVWVCSRCRHVSLDQYSSARHALAAH